MLNDAGSPLSLDSSLESSSNFSTSKSESTGECRSLVDAKQPKMSFGSKEKHDWEGVQNKTFRNWLNHILSSRDMKIADTETDLQDGIAFVALMEELSGKVWRCFVCLFLFPSADLSLALQKVGKINTKPVFRIQKVNNLAVVMQFIKDEGIRVENLGPEDIVNGNLKMVLGLVWTLISHYHVQAGGIGAAGGHGGSARATTLDWARRMATASGQPVDNLSSDWQDGKVLCAIVHTLRPDLIDMDAVDNDSALNNLNLGLGVLEREFQVPHIVDAQDMEDCVDEKSLITFLGEVMKATRNFSPPESSGNVSQRSANSLSANAKPKVEDVPVVKENSPVVVTIETLVSSEIDAEVVEAAPVSEASPLPPKASSPRPVAASGIPNAPSNTVPALLFEAAKQFGDLEAFTDGQEAATWSEHASQVCKVLQGLLAQGVKRGDRVVILGDPKAATRTVYLAVQCAGAVPVCVYGREHTILEISYAIQCSSARMLVVSSPGLWKKVASSDIDTIKTVVFCDGIEESSLGGNKTGRNLLTWPSFIGSAQQTPFSAAEKAILDVRPHDAASWMWTAGMDGAAKPSVATHAMMVSAGHAAQAHLKLTPADVIAAHMAVANGQQQMLDIVVPCISGAQVVYCASGAVFRSICTAVKPSVIAGSPLHWHSLLQSVQSEFSELSSLSAGVKRNIVGSIGLDECKWPLCVWGPLAGSVCQEFRDLGVPLYRVYGVAEACGLVSIEGPDTDMSPEEGVVGRVLSSVSVSFEKGESGEAKQILLRGPAVCSEYGTASSAPRVDDGQWFPTGDFGCFEPSSGLLTMQGRLGDVFQLQSGASLSPQAAECQLRGHPFVQHAIVVGRNQKFAVAFLTLDRSVMEPVAKSRGISVAQLASSPQVGSAVKGMVDDINATRSRDVRIRKFAILPTVHATKGELTPTQVVRRDEVVRHNRKASDALFRPDLSADTERLKQCASGEAPVTLFAGPSVPTTVTSLRDLQEGVTYWTEDGNDVSRSGNSIILSGQGVCALPSDSKDVDEDELALVNMLYADGPAVSAWTDQDQSGTQVHASRAEDFAPGQVYYTEKGTSLERTADDILVVNGTRQIPLEIIASESGTEVTRASFAIPNLDPTEPPASPGSRRLADIRSQRNAEEAERKRKAEEKRALAAKQADEERKVEEERLRLLSEQKALEEEQEPSNQGPTSEHVDEDELAIVNMLYADGPAVTLFQEEFSGQ